MMCAGFLSGIKTHFDFVHNNFVTVSLYGNMNRVVSFSWALICSYLFFVFRSITRRFFRFLVYDEEEDDRRICSSEELDVHKRNEGTDNSVVVGSALSSSSTNKYEFLSGKGISGFVEEPKTLSFKIQEFFECSNGDTVIQSPIRRAEWSTDDDVKEPDLEAEETGDSDGNFDNEKCFEKEDEEIVNEEKGFQEEIKVPVDDGSCTDNDVREKDLDAKASVAEDAEESVNDSVYEEKAEETGEHETIKEEETFNGETSLEDDLIVPLDIGMSEEEESCVEAGETESCVNVPEGKEAETINKANSLEKVQLFGLEVGYEGYHEGPLQEVQFLSKDQNFRRDAEDERPSSDFVDFFSCIYRSDSFEYQCSNNQPSSEGFGIENPVIIGDDKIQEQETGLLRDLLSESDEEYIELEPQEQSSFPSDQNNQNLVHEEAVTSTDESEDSSEGEEIGEELVHEEAEPIGEDLEYCQQNHKNCYSDYDETDSMFEHDDLIEQLKQELKHARTGGLPTILEESESEEMQTPPRIVHELKPLKIDEKVGHGDCMEEIQKVYKTYSDRMRKLDILNFQSMHAFGLLQLKDQIQSQTRRKSSVPALKALLPQPLWSLCKQATAVVDPIKKIIADMHRDFEAVYVGHLCLSWEIMHWQYRKAQELKKYDPQDFHQFNQVAGEFQLFQVLLQRFMENEPFQGPRVQNYVKNRCVVRNLLQVPVLRDDSLKDKERRGDDVGVITNQMLQDTIEQSMRMFLAFLRADKDEISLNLQAQISFQDNVDLQFLMDILTDFQKKEKKLKDILRSGNCIIKKFQKHQEDRIHRTLLCPQVELKLISRVLNMSKLTTDQLVWCHEKLEKISICNRKVLLEPSFVLFPC